VPEKRGAPLQFVRAVQAGFEVLFEDLLMQALRDLVESLNESKGRRGVIRALRKKAVREYIRAT
jgi:hypothetical protein